MSELITQFLKNGCRERKSLMVSMSSISYLFHLFEKFTDDKRRTAPYIYKTLTFLVVECFDNSEVRTEVVQKFLQMFSRFKYIPISILAEPYVKRVQLNLENLPVDHLCTRHAPQILEDFNFNVVDFELFQAIVMDPKVELALH